MHQLSVFIATMTSAALPSEAPADVVVVTASREPVLQDEVPASTSLLDSAAIEGLGGPMTVDLLRLVPGVAVSVAGPAGSQSQVRIRGAEATHSLLFVDGMRFNDPAAGNEARFELLGNDGLSRIEVLRGPQSALWGAEAIGGVIAVETTDPLGPSGAHALVEYGSLDSFRGSVRFAVRTDTFGLSGSGSWIRSDGIDSFGAGGDRDGFRNRTLNLKAAWQPSTTSEVGAVVHWIDGKSQYDGTDPVTFLRADTLDSTRNRMVAMRGWGKASLADWSVSLDASYLDSRNRNALAGVPLNKSAGSRATVSGQLSRRIPVRTGQHRLTVAVEHIAEDFHARDHAFGGATDQDRDRGSTAVVAEWRAGWNDRLVTDIAVRRDSFTRFADATTLRAGLLLDLGRGWSIRGSYGEGIAQPTFYDLFGFFPGSFRGNPDLRPERARAWEAGVAWTSGGTRIALTGFTARLRKEIVETFDSETFLSSVANADGTSRRNGFELELDQNFGDSVRLGFAYTYLDAEQRQTAEDVLVREVRRPRHSASLTALVSRGPFDLGGSLAYNGSRRDTDFDLLPAQTVRLDEYVLASLRIGWRLHPGVEAYARVENAFAADYQEVVGYNTAGRSVHAGLRLSLGD